MTLSYCNDIFGDTKRTKVKAEVTTEHCCSHYGQPVIVLPDGDAIDLLSWTLCDYRIEKATQKEMAMVEKVFENLPAITL